MVMIILLLDCLTTSYYDGDGYFRVSAKQDLDMVMNILLLAY